MTRSFGPLVFAIVLTQHFQIASPAGYPVTLGLLIAPLILSGATAKVNWNPPFLAVGGSTFLMALAALTSTRTFSTTELIRTWALIALALAIVAIAASSSLRPLAYSTSTARWLLGALIVISALSSLQVFAGLSGNDAFFNPFGTHQYLYQYQPQLTITDFPRAHAFYLEPSYAGFVIGTVTICLLNLNYKIWLVLPIALVGMLATQSATGLILALMLSILFALRSTRAPIMGGILVLVIIGLAAEQLIARVSTLAISGSSANYRLIAPLSVVSDVLTEAPLGQPGGTLQLIVASYHLSNGTIVGSSLDNGYYVVVFYFGWFGVLVCATAAAWGIVSMRHRQKSHRDASWLTPAWIVGSLFFTGGIYLPEYVLMVSLTLVLYRATAATTRSPVEENRSVEHESARIYRRGHLPRRTGA